MTTRHYGLKVGDIVKEHTLEGEIIKFSPIDNNKAYIKTKDNLIFEVVCEWCNIIQK